MKAQRKFCFVTICFHSDRQTVPGCTFGNTKLTAPFSSQIAPTLVLGLLSAQSVAKEASTDSVLLRQKFGAGERNVKDLSRSKEPIYSARKADTGEGKDEI